MSNPIILVGGIRVEFNPELPPDAWYAVSQDPRTGHVQLASGNHPGLVITLRYNWELRAWERVSE
jgi:hypothetical protein